jgi:hypothetical protein
MEETTPFPQESSKTLEDETAEFLELLLRIGFELDGPNCGHEEVPHGDHVDYLVNGRLHHTHGDHCDDHRPMQLA